MKEFNKLFPKNLYHSYVIEGEVLNSVNLLQELLIKRGEIRKQSPDLFLGIYDSFSKDNSLDIKEWHKNKIIDSKKKICIIGASFINWEAEQALLKIIEEPTLNTHIFIIVPDSSLLQDTIISRVHLIKNKSIINDLQTKYANDFIKMKLEDRFDIILEIIRKNKDNLNSGGLRSDALLLINSLEKIYYKKWKTDTGNDNNKFILDELVKLRSYLSTSGASVKMILEHAALML